MSTNIMNSIGVDQGYYKTRACNVNKIIPNKHQKQEYETNHAGY